MDLREEVAQEKKWHEQLGRLAKTLLITLSVGLVLGVAVLVAVNLSLFRTTEQLTAVMDKRVPTLEYMVCHDRALDQALQKAFDYFEAPKGPNATPEQNAEAARLYEELTEARERLRHSVDPDHPERCKGLEVLESDG